jgi:hypothetical protein
MNFKIIVIFVSLFLFYKDTLAQANKSGNTFIFGGGALKANFTDSINTPAVGQLWPIAGLPYGPYFFSSGHSSICDKISGDLLILNNGMIIYNKQGSIIEGGDSLVSSHYFNYHWAHTAPYTQNSLILPKNNSNQYYIFNPSVTDSVYDYYKTMSTFDNQKYGTPSTQLLYHIVDMNANAGLGKVISLNNKLLENRRLNKVGMMACRHANGTDWWLLKNGEYDSMIIYKFLVTADTIFPADSQIFKTAMDIRDWGGQSSFSKSGNKYCFAMARTHKLFIADFDRCTGILSNEKIANIPFDSTLDPFDAWQGRLDSTVHGTAFSANDSFIYITTEFNVYQYEIYSSNSINAWYHVQYGPDTLLAGFGLFGHMLRAVDDKIYLGQSSGTFGGLGIINFPNKKGAACGYCPRCLRDNNGYYSPTAPSNMPDYTLGAKPELCWPVANKPIENTNQTILYPNPANTNLTIDKACAKKGSIEIYNTIGQRVKMMQLNNGELKEQINIYDIQEGIYVYKILLEGCATSTGKIEIKH